MNKGPASVKREDMERRWPEEKTLGDYIARKSDPLPHQLTYMETINHPCFRAASYNVLLARKMLREIMTQEEAYEWIKAWASGAGDGSE